MYIYIYICVCIRISKWTHTYIYIYICIPCTYICIYNIHTYLNKPIWNSKQNCCLKYSSSIIVWFFGNQDATGNYEYSEYSSWLVTYVHTILDTRSDYLNISNTDVHNCPFHLWEEYWVEIMEMRMCMCMNTKLYLSMPQLSVCLHKLLPICI